MRKVYYLHLKRGNITQFEVFEGNWLTLLIYRFKMRKWSIKRARIY